MAEKDTVAFEQDIAKIKEDIAAIKAELKHAATKAELQEVRFEIEKMGRTIIMWLSGMIIASTGIILAVPRLPR
jgi:septal ring factor EnvC (AmiA/AmiB activator)